MARLRGRTEVAETREIDKVMSQLRKDYGASSVALGSSIIQPARIPSGVFVYDFALLGGVPVNRISMFVGEKSAGKSTMSDLIVAGALNMFPDTQAVKIDIEGTHDSVWSSKLGVDQGRLTVFQPDSGEQAVDVTDAFIHTKEVSIVVVDSIAMLSPMKEIEADAEDAMVGEQARMVNRMVRKATSAMVRERKRDHVVTLIFINQFRMKIGVMFGDPRTMPGGKGLDFCTSVQTIIKNKETKSEDEFDLATVEYNTHTFEIIKNKVNAGTREGEFKIRRRPHPEWDLQEGDIDDADTLFAYAIKLGVCAGQGSSWQLQFRDVDQKLRGKADACKFLYANPEIKWKLRNHLIQMQAVRQGMPDYFLEQFE